MRKFIKKGSILLLFTLISIHIKPLILIYKGGYNIYGYEIWYSIKKSKKKSKAKNLIIGDSVCKQMFDNQNDSINSLACNQSISLVGQYILLSNYLNSGNHIDTLYLIYTPFSFLNNLDQVFTFHYFLKPFYNKEYSSYFTSTVTNQIKKIPFYWLIRDPYFLTSNWSPDFKSKDKVSFNFLSPISAEYLYKIKCLSTKYKFKFVILPTPTRISYMNTIHKIGISEISKYNLSTEFSNYFKTITYINDSNFIDDVHLKKPLIYAAFYKMKFVRNIQL